MADTEVKAVDAPVAAAAVPAVVELTYAEAEKARAEKRTGTLFAVAKEDTSAMMKQFEGVKGLKKAGADDEDDLALLGGKTAAKKAAHSTAAAAAPAEEGEEAPLKTADLWGFKYGAEQAPRSDSGRGRGRGRGRGGFSSDRPRRTDGDRADGGERAPFRGSRGGGRGRGRGGAAAASGTA